MDSLGLALGEPILQCVGVESVITVHDASADSSIKVLVLVDGLVRTRCFLDGTLCLDASILFGDGICVTLQRIQFSDGVLLVVTTEDATKLGQHAVLFSASLLLCLERFRCLAEFLLEVSNNGGVDDWRC